MSVDVRVQGYCPMGCGETLELEIRSGEIRCTYYNEETYEECTQPYAVYLILSSRETEHIVEIGSTTFSVKHPLRERVLDALFRCDIHERLAALPSSPVPPDTYRVDDNLNFTRLSGGNDK